MNYIFPLVAIMTILNNNTLMAQNKITQTAGHAVLGEFAPKFAELNDNVLFGEDVWNDSTLSLHDRSMITISVLLGKGSIDSSFRSHLEMGKRHGITREEIAALLTQAAFYAGWPNAWAGFREAKEIWADNHATTEKERFGQEMIFPVGEPNTEYRIRRTFQRQQLHSTNFDRTGSVRQCHVRAAMPQQPSHSPRDRRRRPNAGRRGRTRMVSRMANPRRRFSPGRSFTSPQA